jgi:hypothetical protein
MEKADSILTGRGVWQSEEENQSRAQHEQARWTVLSLEFPDP